MSKMVSGIAESTMAEFTTFECHHQGKHKMRLTNCEIHYEITIPLFVI